MPLIPRRAILAAPFIWPAIAQAFPERPLRIIVPFPPGGAADFLGRAVGERLSRSLIQPVTIENRTGAGGNIGTAAAAQAERDGHTLLLNGVPIAVNRFLFANLPFDAERDFTPVGMLAIVPNIMVVPVGLPVNSVAEFVALARTRPMNYASIGNGTSLHLAGAQFALATGLNLTHVPYRETGAANTDLMAGRVEVMFETLPGALPFIRDGRLRALAVTDMVRSPLLPEVPTMAEAGLPGVQAVAWFAVYAPGRTELALRRRLAEDIAAVQRSPEGARALDALGLTVEVQGPEALGARAEAERARFGEVVRAARITLE